MSGKKGGPKLVVWGVLGLLIVALGGFGTVNFGGTVTSVGAVGKTQISTAAYANALRGELQSLSAQLGQNLTAQQAADFGITAGVFDQLADAAALDNAAEAAGLSVGDQAVFRELAQIDAFHGLDGKIDPQLYRDALRRAGLTETQFEADLRREAARAILQGALATGVTMPDAYAQVVIDWLGERRTVATVSVTPADLLTGTPVAGDADIQATYEANPDRYTAPEITKVTYAWLTPAMLADEVDLDETALRELYDSTISQYVTPERRLVERLVYATQEEAEAAATRIASGESSFEAEVALRGLDLADTDMGDVTLRALGAAGPDVFALEGTGVVGPLASDLGPALFRVNGTLPGSEITFEEALPELRAELAADAGARMIGDLIEPFDDLLASGATVEELAAETEMELGTLDVTPETEGGIAAYAAFKAAVAAAEPGDFPEIIELSDGGVFALRVDEIVPPTLQPLAEVRDQVAADWEAAEIARLLEARAREIETQVLAGTPIDSLGLPTQRFEEITRRDFISTMPDGFIDAVFGPGLTANGATVLSDGSARAVVALVEAVLPPEADSDLAAIAESYAESAAQGAAEDLVAAFARAVRTREGVTINQTAINAVNSQL